MDRFTFWKCSRQIFLKTEINTKIRRKWTLLFLFGRPCSKMLTIAFCCCTDRPHRHGKHHRTMTASSRLDDSSFPLLDNMRRSGQELRVRLAGDVGVEHPGGKDHSRLSKHTRGVYHRSRRRSACDKTLHVSLGVTTPTQNGPRRAGNHVIISMTFSNDNLA